MSSVSTQPMELPKSPRDKILDTTDEHVLLKRTNMGDYKQTFAIVSCIRAMGNYFRSKDIARYIKREFDAKYSPTWHCIVGKQFSSYITHDTKEYIYFLVGNIAVLLFRF